jgi:hypothetical protein
MATSTTLHSRRDLRRPHRAQPQPSARAAQAAPVKPLPMPDLSGMAAAIEDVRRAALVSDRGPEDETSHPDLMARLDAAGARVPPLYRESAYRPYKEKLAQLGPAGFQQILLSDPRRERAAGLMLDLAHAFLQNGERYEDVATDAAQEVMSDLYDGFLSAEDRRGVKPPDLQVTPPLAKWGNPDFGPYTWPVDATLSFGVKVAIVSLPPANARGGLLAWTALGHEIAGHDILHADRGLEAEVADTVRSELEKDKAFAKHRLSDYWADRIDETASDVLGILNAGPTAAAGLIGYFRGLGAAWGGSARLRADGPANDPHPSDLLRAYLGAAVVERLAFSRASAWAGAIRGEADQDAPASGTLRLAGLPVPLEVARASAERVAEVIATTPFARLEHHAFITIQNWQDHDEEMVRELARYLQTAASPGPEVTDGFYAAHVVAAAATLALSGQGVIAAVFDRMIGLLELMHDANPAWGPLFVAHPGNLYRHRGYVPAAA